MWVKGKPKNSFKVDEILKHKVQGQVQAIIDKYFSPNIVTPPKGNKYNYISGIYLKWYRNYLYFISKYECPGPNAISPSFETKFTRIECQGHNSFNLSYMRHTGSWQEVYRELGLEETMQTIIEEILFHPLM